MALRKQLHFGKHGYLQQTQSHPCKYFIEAKATMDKDEATIREIFTFKSAVYMIFLASCQKTYLPGVNLAKFAGITKTQHPDIFFDELGNLRWLPE